MTTATSPRARAGALLCLAALSACGGRHYLADYDFAGRSLAVAYFGTPAPSLHTGHTDVEADDPIGAVIAASGRVVREVEARRARSRLDSAAHRVDLAARLADRTLERSARYLAARPEADRAAADYLMEVDVHDLGLEARGDGIRLFVRGEAVLLDTRTGREIWSQEVTGTDRLSPDMVDGSVMEDVLGAGALTMMSVEDFETVLRRLADFAADRFARELRADLRDARDQR